MGLDLVVSNLQATPRTQQLVIAIGHCFPESSLQPEIEYFVIPTLAKALKINPLQLRK